MCLIYSYQSLDFSLYLKCDLSKIAELLMSQKKIKICSLENEVVQLFGELEYYCVSIYSTTKYVLKFI